MRPVIPKALRQGDVIGICAPASAPSSEETLTQGISYLEKLGYRVELGKNVHHQRGYLAGTDAERASDIHYMFADRRVKAIFTVRGGYGTHRILPLLNYTVIKHNPKILVGYSDITALQLALFTKTGLVTFSGPMVTAEMAKGLHGTAEEEFWRCLTSTKSLTPIQCERDNQLLVQKGRTSTGRLIGGNLSLVASLTGTPFIPHPDGLILFLEEIDERPYRIDRMLQQLSHAGFFKRSRGIVFGRFINCTPERGKPSLKLQQVIKDTFRQYPFTLLAGLHYGHLNDSLTLPLGVRVRLNAASRKLEFLEGCVS